MAKICIICNGDGKYKCPTCLVYYCSVQCCNKHRLQKCDVVLKKDSSGDEKESNTDNIRYTTHSTVPKEKLENLRHDKHLNDLLTNPHLCNILKYIDSSDNPEVAMQKAMLEPIFVEFADACLKVVEPSSFDDQNT